MSNSQYSITGLTSSVMIVDAERRKRKLTGDERLNRKYVYLYKMLHICTITNIVNHYSLLLMLAESETGFMLVEQGKESEVKLWPFKIE